MSEIRQNLVTKDWVIIATERAKRPEDFKKKGKSKITLPEFESTCPFCPGNEQKMSPDETLRIEKNGGWQVRIIPNKFPALSKTGERIRTVDGIKRKLTGVGLHEVVIETPLHNLTTALLPTDDVRNIIKSYKMRYNEMLKDKRIEMIIIFKNHGEAAGTSLIHPHSQIVATPVVPAQVRERFNDAQKYFDENFECVFCKILSEELKDGSRIVFETKHFVAFIPYAALSPFHCWIYPKKHYSNFGDITEDEISDLAVNLQTTLKKYYFGLDNPDFNYVIRSAPTDLKVLDFFHWYISIIPRITKTAGFELGSGMFINSSLPENDAKFLREVKV
ncbi:MAG: galactose-1-phosphate uridylyltransferase [Elusimicrobia bacterium HGW-Elusimicrobia-4]|nr:MAG: galactose-1-phosphate uridylyltransferase [Elusimicrobia bacterium HGW-Elusimicrobia-4]